ncbi:hypothetical protein G6M26_42190 [Agrobacterium tumefaciens]|nr:hypothetical protein [Agrobacterium tumefaciens]NTE25157.1 hypothetical protein [Agrobacterium tumefaciens]
MKYIFLLMVLIFTIKTSAQNCNCGDNFKYLTTRITKNYVGYADKVTSKNQLKFQQFTDSLQQVSNRSNAYQCLSLCREWLDFFKDKHIDFGMDFSKISPDTVRAFFADEEKTSWSENTFKSYLQQNNMKLDSIEGIWSYGIYEVGIVKDQTKKSIEFIGFVIKADSSRCQYKTVYFSGGDHSVNFPKLIMQKDLLDFGFFGKWKKEERKTKSISPAKIIPPNLGASFKVLDEETSMLTLPSFDIKYKNGIDSIIDNNKDCLMKTKHLIVDVRDNPGGTTGSFEKLIPYIYTNPIYVDGGIVLATEDNIRDCYEKDFSVSSIAIRNKIKNNNKKLRAHLGEFVLLYKPETIKLSKTLKHPEIVSILINENTASSAEYFILRAAQSKKVTLFGQNTSGTVDYGEIAHILHVHFLHLYIL